METILEEKSKKGIMKQWEEYFNQKHYDRLLKKKDLILDKHIKEKEKNIDKKEKLLKEFKEIEKEKVFEIETKKGIDKKEIFIHVKDISKKTFLEKLGFFSFDGYMFYLNKAEDLKIYKIKNMRFIYDLINKKESYFMIKKLGTYKGKPFFLVKYPIPISLDIDIDTQELFYDTESLYNYVNIATKGNLTNLPEKTDIGKFLSKNIIWIVLIIAIVLLLMTPQGKEFISKFVSGMQQPKG